MNEHSHFSCHVQDVIHLSRNVTGAGGRRITSEIPPLRSRDLPIDCFQVTVGMGNPSA